MAKYPDAKTILPLMKQISLLWVDTTKLTAFLELGMTYYFTVGRKNRWRLLFWLYNVFGLVKCFRRSCKLSTVGFNVATTATLGAEDFERSHSYWQFFGVEPFVEATVDRLHGPVGRNWCYATSVVCPDYGKNFVSLSAQSIVCKSSTIFFPSECLTNLRFSYW